MSLCEVTPSLASVADLDSLVSLFTLGIKVQSNGKNKQPMQVVATLIEKHTRFHSLAAAAAAAHLQEESALYCPSGGKTPAGAADGLVLHWGYGACQNINKKVNAQTTQAGRAFSFANTYHTTSSQLTRELEPPCRFLLGRGVRCLAYCSVFGPSWPAARAWCGPTESSGPARRTRPLCSLNGCSCSHEKNQRNKYFIPSGEKSVGRSDASGTHRRLCRNACCLASCSAWSAYCRWNLSLKWSKTRCEWPDADVWMRSLMGLATRWCSTPGPGNPPHVIPEENFKKL